MEITLALTGKGSQVALFLGEELSHHFDLLDLAPDDKIAGRPPQPLDDPRAFGQAVYQALFPQSSPAAAALANRPQRILLVARDRALQSVPWEYAYDQNEGFLVRRTSFLRGLAPEQRRPAPDLSQTELHITAVPSNPLHPGLAPLAIEEEWLRLAQVVDGEGAGVTLERVRPPSLEQLRRQVAGHDLRVVHFMGHGSRDDEEGAFLLFEKTDGALDLVPAQDFIDRVGKNAILITLNACVSATPGATEFDNVARALVERGVPYALGMRFSIGDNDARIFSRAFYSNLAAGEDVEEALRQARLSLIRDGQDYAVGVPVLFTSLDEPAGRFQRGQGEAQISDPMQVRVALEALPRVDGVFHGRARELQAIGEKLTSDTPPRLLTIHGVGGQGKTAVVRQAAERFSFAFRAGAYALNLEALPTKEEFLSGLAHFLGLNPDDFSDGNDLLNAVIGRLQTRRLLLILDNAETLLQAVDREEEGPRALMQFIRQQISLPTVTMLVTSRRWTEWPGEEKLQLPGLPPADGAALFRANTPNRRDSYSMDQARGLSRKIDGHPLSLRLLASAYNAAAPLSFEAFEKVYEQQLLNAEDLLQDPRHRHRSLAAALRTSIDYLPRAARALLGHLWVWHGPFLPQFAPWLVEPDSEEDKESEVPGLLALLQRRGLLAVETPTFRDGPVLIYRLLPALRPYVAQLPQAMVREELLARFGQVQAAQLRYIYGNMQKGGLPVYLARQGLEDLERGLDNVQGETAVAYLRRLGWVMQILGNRKRGLEVMQKALDLAGEDYSQERLQILNNMAMVYRATGRPAEALALYEEALPIRREVGDRAGEATTLNNMAAVYDATGRPAEALALYEEALPIMREVGDRAGEATTLNNMAAVYRATGRPAEALALYEEALPIMREVGDRAGEAATLNNMAAVYDATGRPAEALALYEEALPIMREVGDRAGEAATLNNMAMVYYATGRPAEALALYEEALPIMREVGDRAGEAATLNNMAMLYQATGRPAEALALYEEALPIMREVGDRAGEATTLNNMAMVYQATGRPAEALALYEEALPIRREVGDRAGEATTLNNMAMVYQATGRPAEALALYEEALPIRREVGDRAGEATTLNNMAMVYRATGRPAEALALYEEALPIRREVGDRAGEAATLNNMAGVYRATGRPAEALALYEEALPIMREVGDRAGEAVTLWNMGQLLQQLDRLPDAITRIEDAIALFRAGLTHDATGDTVEGYENLLQKLQSGESPAPPGPALQQDDLQKALVAFVNTESWAESRRVVEEKQALLLAGAADARLAEQIAAFAGQGNQGLAETLQQHKELLLRCRAIGIDAAFAELQETAHSEPADPLQRALQEFVNSHSLGELRGILQTNSALLLSDQAEEILAGLVARVSQESDRQVKELLEMHLEILRRCKAVGIDAALNELQEGPKESPFPPDLPRKAVAALRGDSTQKLALAQQVAVLSAGTDDPAQKAFYTALQNAIFGANLATAGANLEEPYARAWQAIVQAVNSIQ